MDPRVKTISIEIEKIKAAINRLDGLSNGLPALERNLRRITASIKMLELNFVDPGITAK